MNMSGKVLACVDRSRFADYVTDYAAWAAGRLEAPLELLHVIDRHPEIGSGEDHSGALGIDASEALLTQLSEKDAVVARAARETGRIFLNRLRDRAVAAGVDATDVRQRHGTLAETLAEQASATRLYVLGRRGESSEITQRDLGRQVEHVARAVTQPILTVSQVFSVPRRVMIAFDGGAMTRRGVDMVAVSPLFRGLPIVLLMSGKERKDGPKQIAWATERLRATGFDVESLLLPGDTERTVAKVIRDREVDILIMGAYAHSPLRSLVLGSRTNDLLRSAKIPTLLLR